MFCSKCGQELPNGSKFCPACGEPSPANVQEQEAQSQGNQSQEASYQDVQNPYRDIPEREAQNQNSGQSEQNSNASGGTAENANQKIDIKALLTDENIERYAPLAAFLPLAMGVVVGVVGRILRMIPIVGPIVRFLLIAVFVLAALGATVGLFYLALKKKDSAKVTTWITPVIVLLAFVACVCNCFHWTAVAVVLGLITVVMGLDFLARITISGKSMDSPINVGEDIGIYKDFYADYKKNNPTTTELERKGIADPENSSFDGSGFELLGLQILMVIVSGITCGIGAPWMICKVYRWRIDHTVINGKRLKFDGTGAELLGKWIIWGLLTVVTCGIYSFFANVALRKWELSHTHIDGEAEIVGQTTSYFDGNSFEFLGYSILGGLLVICTCGLGTPWMVCMIQKWDTKHQVINGRRLVFSGSGLGFLGEFIIISLLSLVTCGIYQAWGTVRMNKYIIRHTDFV